MVTLNVTSELSPDEYTIEGGAITGQVGVVSVTIPVNHLSVDLTVRTFDDDIAGGEKHLIFRLVDGVIYDLGLPNYSDVTVKAGDYIVNTLNADGNGSLRVAIENANRYPTDDIITFQVSGTILISRWFPGIQNNGSLIIEGANITLDGQNQRRLITVYNNAVATINGMTIINGLSTGYDRDGSGGGGIMNYGTLTLNGVTVHSNTNNYSMGGFGGGIYNNGTLTLIDSRVVENYSHYKGGGIFNVGTLTLVDSIVMHNYSYTSGGGIYNTGTLTVDGSLVSGNSAQEQGGGLYLEGTALIVNSTVMGNNSAVGGGSITVDATGEATLHYVTVTDNVTQASSTAGVLNYGTLAITNSIIANSKDTVGTIGDCQHVSGTLTIAYSSVEDGSCITAWTNGNISGDPALATQMGDPGYRLLRADSPALNAGNAALVPGVTVDQRGLPRVVGSAVDMGAVESNGGASLILDLTFVPPPEDYIFEYYVPVDVELRPLAGGVPIVDDFYSRFSYSEALSFADLPFGDYTVWLKGLHSLAEAQTFTLGAGTTTITQALLREGDVNSDNRVTIHDFGMFAAAFGAQTYEDRYNSQADFNHDTIINILDFSLLAASFGQSGAP